MGGVATPLLLECAIVNLAPRRAYGENTFIKERAIIIGVFVSNILASNFASLSCVFCIKVNNFLAKSKNLNFECVCNHNRKSEKVKQIGG